MAQEAKANSPRRICRSSHTLYWMTPKLLMQASVKWPSCRTSNRLAARTQITDAGFKEVAKLQQLEILILNNTQITDEGLKEVAKLQNLKALGLSYTQITDAALKKVANLKSLTGISMDGTKITDAGPGNRQV